MQENKGINRFNQLIAFMAWVIFWAVINGICLALRFAYRIRATSTKPDLQGDFGPLRVGFCENGAGYGGAIISLAAFLEKRPRQFEAMIYTSIGTGQYSRLGNLGRWRHIPPVRTVNAAWLNGIGFPYASLVDNLFNLLPYAWRYYLVFKRDNIQCVYLNNDASCNFAAAIAANFARLPLILHARGFNCDTKGNRWVLSKVDHCIAVSDAVRTELISLGVPEEKCTIVPEGIDLTVFHPRPASDSTLKDLGLRGNESVITLVGGLVDWKGQDILLDAAPLIFQKFPDAIIFIVGAAYGKDNRYANMLAERASAPEIRSRVHLLGARQDVAEILACSDVVVHASTKPEPFGRTFLEGMALGKAVIASNEGGPLDVISHEVDGLLIQPRNPRILAEAVGKILSNSDFSTALGKNAATKAKNYSIENHANSISRILQLIASGYPVASAPMVSGSRIDKGRVAQLHKVE